MIEAKQEHLRPRLKFIDLARSIAILLMLEGHFVGLTLSLESRDPSNPAYLIWNFIRGFTAPLFFTVAGMIFVFLLTGEQSSPFFKRERVRKGFKRALELLFWGYALQITVSKIPGYFRGDFETWVFAFHVLQCIGVALIALILIAGLQQFSKRLPLVFWYAGAVVICMAVYIWLKSLPQGTYVPTDWPQVFQNALRGPRTVFPLAPWLGFTFLGGAMGAYIRSISHRPITQMSCAWFFGLALGLIVVWLAAGILPISANASAALTWFFERAAEVVVFLGILRWLEIRFGIGVPWMLRVGRETFSIYILHVIVLYGGLFGIGLNRWLKNELNPWQAAGGAALFLLVFILFAQAVTLAKKQLGSRKLG